MSEDRQFDHAEQILMGVWRDPEWFFIRENGAVYRTMLLADKFIHRFEAPPMQLYIDADGKRCGKNKDYILKEKRAHDNTTTTNI